MDDEQGSTKEVGGSNRGMILCVNCIYCILGRNKKIRCDNGYFFDMEYKDVILYTPYDFECVEYEGVDSNEEDVQ